MSRLLATREICRNQVTQLARALRGDAVTAPSFGSMTLDPDDVEIALASLADPAAWRDPAPTAAYEDAFAHWNGSRDAVAFMGGRVALSACLHALQLRPGDEVVLPGYTCVVVDNALRFAGLQPVYCDIELETFGPNVEEVARRITPRTRAILIHHLYGLVCRDYDAIVALAHDRDIRLIEDCAHASGASYRGRRVGNRGDVAFFSSEQSKVLSTGQGGIATTNNPAIAERLRAYQAAAPFPHAERIASLLRTIAFSYYAYKHPHRWIARDLALLRFGMPLESTTRAEEDGHRPEHYGERMPAPVASIGLNQLRKVDRYNEERRAAAAAWEGWCEREGFAAPRVIEGSTPVFLRYPVLMEPHRKADPRWARATLGVDLGVWFRTHLHPAPRAVENLPCADAAVAGCVNLPTLLPPGVTPWDRR